MLSSRLKHGALFAAIASFFLFVASAFSAEARAPIVWQGNTDIATGRGERGPWQQNASRYDYVDDPTVALDGKDGVAVAWVDQARKDIFFQRLAADGSKQLAQAVNVSRSPATFSWLPRIAFAPQAPHQVFLLWQEIIFSGGSHGGDILFARSDDGGAHFSEPANLSRSIGGDGKGRINRDVWHNGSFDLAAGPDGALYAAWTDYDGPLWFSRSVDGGKNFSRPQRIAGDKTRPARAPSLALAPDRSIFLAWTTGEDAAADIHVAKSIDRGSSFSAPLIVAPSKTYSDAPKLAVGPDGVLHLVYAESVGGPFERCRIRYTRSVDGARSFAAPRDISNPLPVSATSAAYPALAMDGEGNPIVLWEILSPPRADSEGLAHGLGLTVSRDGGNSFAPPMLVPESSDPSGGSNGSHQGLLMKKLAVNGNGALAIVNSSLKQDSGSRVWLTRAMNPFSASSSGTR